MKQAVTTQTPQLVHSDDVAQQAIIWAERQADGLTDAGRQLLAQWLNADRDHLEAFKAARRDQARLQGLAQALATDPANSLALRAAIALDKPLPVRSWPARLAAVAASLLLGFWLWTPDYRTGIGELEVVTLPDGSRLTLNAGTRVDLAYSKAERRIILRAGEVYAEVAKNPDRPFIVQSARGEARAVGTAFSVRMREGSDRVIVTEGLVEVSAGPALASGPVSVSAGMKTLPSGQLPVRLAANQMVNVASQVGLVTERDAEAVAQSLAWRDRRLYFSNVALEEFVAEMNRYSYRHMVIADAGLSGVRVGGAFDTGDTESALELLSAGFGVKVVEVTPWLALLYEAPARVE